MSGSIRGNTATISRRRTVALRSDSQGDIAMYRAKAEGKNTFRFHSAARQLEIAQRTQPGPGTIAARETSK